MYYSLAALGCVVTGEVDWRLMALCQSAFAFEMEYNPVYTTLHDPTTHLTILALTVFAPRHAAHVYISLNAVKGLGAAQGVSSGVSSGIGRLAQIQQGRELLHALNDIRGWVTRLQNCERAAPHSFAQSFTGGEAMARASYLANGAPYARDTAHAPRTLLAAP